VPVQARRVQVVFSSDLVARLARRQPPINFGAFEVLTGAALSIAFRKVMRSEFTVCGNLSSRGEILQVRFNQGQGHG
jgi:hypothetical protein